MPCSDSLNSGGVVYQTNPLNEELQRANVQLEAVLCAILSELTSKMTTESLTDFCLNASKNSNIDVLEFWNRHKGADVMRLKQKLKGYSKHELDLIKGILNEE